MKRRDLLVAALFSALSSNAWAEKGNMRKALLHVDIADLAWFTPDTTVEIEVDLREHVFRRAVLGNEVRGVFATYSGKRVMLLQKANEVFSWNPGCAVSIVAPIDGNWGEGEVALAELRLEYVGKAFVEIPGWPGEATV